MIHAMPGMMIFERLKDAPNSSITRARYLVHVISDMYDIRTAKGPQDLETEEC